MKKIISSIRKLVSTNSGAVIIGLSIIVGLNLNPTIDAVKTAYNRASFSINELVYVYSGQQERDAEQAALRRARDAEQAALQRARNAKLAAEREAERAAREAKDAEERRIKREKSGARQELLHRTWQELIIGYWKQSQLGAERVQDTLGDYVRICHRNNLPSKHYKIIDRIADDFIAKLNNFKLNSLEFKYEDLKHYGFASDYYACFSSKQPRLIACSYRCGSSKYEPLKFNIYRANRFKNKL
jgi:flagellar biosynthesis GTPase FlhF